jgi:competence protein ComEC
MLLADIERLGELELLEKQRGRLPSNALLVAHHGSRGASSEGWVAAVRPSEALISVGHGNSFGHPHAEVLARYREAGSRIWRTDRGGAIRLDFTQEGSFVRSWRHEQRRYWHAL